MTQGLELFLGSKQPALHFNRCRGAREAGPEDVYTPASAMEGGGEGRGTAPGYLKVLGCVVEAARNDSPVPRRVPNCFRLIDLP